MKTTIRRRRTNDFEEIPVNQKQQPKAAAQDHQALADDPPSSTIVPPLKDDDDQEELGRPEPINETWTRFTEGVLHANLRNFNVKLATTSAKYPRLCLGLITFFSFAVVSIGLATNFELVFSHSEIFTPVGSRPRAHASWIEHDSGFHSTDDFVFLIHSEGEDVMNIEAMRRLFFLLDTLRNMDGYRKACSQSSFLNMDGEPDCWIWSPTHFWNNNVTEFEETVSSDEDLVRALSQQRFQDGTPVFQEALFGKYKSVNETFVYNAVADEIFYYPHEHDYLTYVPNYFVDVGMPYIEDTWTFQKKALDKFADIRIAWQKQSKEENPYNIQLEFFCSYAYELEYARALTRDFPLIPAVFFIMLGFTCFIFHRYGLQQAGAPTRATVGMASVVTVGMSLMSGFGIMFCFGVPFTNITLMAPFIILGVGLDDTFIITGAYFRRIKEEIQERERQQAEQRAKHSRPLSKEELLRESDDSSSNSSNNGATTENNSVADTSSPVEQLYDHSVIVERVRSSMEEVGMSISLTTITTTTAFVLGCISTIPGIRWLCMYASVTIVFDAFYQVTYFVALLTLDERRVVLAQAKAMVRQEQALQRGQQPSYCSNSYKWVSNKYSKMFYGDGSDEDESSIEEDGGQEHSAVFVERFMAWYSRTLLRPRVRNAVIFFCMALFGLCIYSTTQLRQRFDPQDYVPDDSYTQGFFDKLHEYSALILTFEVYFRNVDQSDPKIQKQMRDYIFELSELPQIGKKPDFCWVVDMAKFFHNETNFDDLDLSRLSEKEVEQATFLISTLQAGDYTFEEKLSLALSVPAIRDVYGEDIVLNEAGEIVTSRCFLYVRQFDLEDVQAQIEFLHEQRSIAASQQVNTLPENQNEWAFFAYSSFHGYWELYAVAIEELIFTTIWGVVAVCVVGFLIIPHWTAVVFVGPLIVMLYFDLLGIMQFCGIHVNALTYVTIVISIGLLVDFLMHILLRYYETTGKTRDAKVKQTLETMGASMMLGGFTTWLGVIPMALSTTDIFMTIFIAFLAMVSLGLLIGLAFLPAVLAIWGPVVCVSTHGPSCKKVRQPGLTQNATGESPSSSSLTSAAGAVARSLANPYQLVAPVETDIQTTNPTPVIPEPPQGRNDDENLNSMTENNLVTIMPDEDDDEEVAEVSKDHESSKEKSNESDGRDTGAGLGP